MEPENHSKGRLALAILTSPGAAFEEIIRRKLLGAALAITALTGAAACVATIMQARMAGPVQLLALGKDNPLIWLGLCLLYGIGLQFLLRWTGSEVEFADLLTILGWSQLSLLLSQLIFVAGLIVATTSPHPSAAALNALDLLHMALQLYYAIIVGVGIHCISRVALFRSTLAYIMLQLGAMLAFGIFYGQWRLGPFTEGYTGIISVLLTLTGDPQNWLQWVVAQGVDRSAWAAAGLLGLGLGLWKMGCCLEWDAKRRKALVSVTSVVGAAALLGYVSIVNGYYASLTDIQHLDRKGDYHAMATRLARLEPVYKSNGVLILEIGNAYCAAGEPDKAIEHYNKFIDIVRAAKFGEYEARVLAPAYSGLGAAYDLQSHYDQAITAFNKAVKAWPEFRDPWVRMAVTRDRMGDYKRAIDSANHAVKNLGSEAVCAWVALAEGFAQTGDLAQAKAAYAKVRDTDEDLAKAIGAKPENWKTAVDHLSASMMRFPLEKTPAPEPKQPKAKKS